MRRRHIWRHRLAGACGVLVLGALGTALVAAMAELSFASPAGDLAPPPRHQRLAAVSRGSDPAFGPPVPFGARRYANDPTAEGRAR